MAYAEAAERIFEKVTNPRGFEHPAKLGALIGMGVGYATSFVISEMLHRGVHGGVTFDRSVQQSLTVMNYVMTGMTQLDWTDHLAHHAFPDREDHDAMHAWNEQRPNGAPEATIKVFRDPYSIVLEGYKRVFFDTGGLHREAKKEIVPFLTALNKFDKREGITDHEHWPAPYRHLDIDAMKPNAFYNKYPFVGLVGAGAVRAAVLGPKVELAATGTHLTTLLAMGGFVNAVNHTGETPEGANTASEIWHRIQVLRGKREPLPNVRGEYAANIFRGVEGLLSGEPHHEYHHENPGDPFLVGRKNTTLLRDPPGALILELERRGLARTPGSPQKNLVT